MREIDLNKYMTVDSVGEIDINDDDIDLDAILNSEMSQENEEDDGKERTPLGAQFIQKVQAYYCELCDSYSSSSEPFEDFLKKHCLLRPHLKAFIRHKEEEEKAESKKDKPEEEAEDNGDSKNAENEENNEHSNDNENAEKAEEETENLEDKDWEDENEINNFEEGHMDNDEDYDEHDESVLNLDIER